MKKALLSLALCAAAMTSAFANVTTPKIDKVIDGGTLYQAYPVSVTNDPNACFIGATPDCLADTTYGSTIRAIPGIFCLGERQLVAQLDGSVDIKNTFDIKAFVCTPGCTDQVIQSWRIEKVIGESEKCPLTYDGTKYYWFGSAEKRTWWTLLYTSPNTTFSLIIQGVCRENGKLVTFRNTWNWKVGVTFETLLAAIDVMHTHPIGTLEWSCLPHEDFFHTLRNQIDDLRVAVKLFTEDTDNDANRVAAQNKVFETEALITSCCAFTDCFMPEAVFSGQFPAGDAIQMGDDGYTGILDTWENPCCCKIIADVEELSKSSGVVSN